MRRAYKINMVAMEEKKIDVVVKLNRGKRKKDELPKVFLQSANIQKKSKNMGWSDDEEEKGKVLGSLGCMTKPPAPP